MKTLNLQQASESVAAAPGPRRRRSSTRKWLPWAAGIAVVSLIVAGFWPKPVPVELAAVRVGSLRATVDEEGKTRIKQRFVISAPVAGRLRRIALKAGAEVAAGKTVLAVLDPLPSSLLDPRSRALAEARRDTAAANLEKAGEAHRFASSELKRIEGLYAKSVVSIQELESSQWRESSAAKEKAAAQSALKEAEAELAESVSGATGAVNAARPPVEVIAANGGRVLRVFEESERPVAAGTPLIEVGDPRDLEVVVEVLSRDGAAMAPGTKMELEQWGGSEPLQARVRLVEPAAFTKVSALGVEEQRVNVVADLVTPPEKRMGLGDNFRVEARIIVWQAERAIKVPSAALFRQGDKWAAYVVNDGRAQLRQVKVGHSSGDEAEVLEGLKEGEPVILYPGERIHDHQRVRIVRI